MKFAIWQPVDEGDADVLGQPEQLSDPSAGNFLRDRAGRRHDVETGVLVPGRREPVGRHGGRQRAAGDESEIARSGGGDETGFGGTRQLIDDGQRLCGAVGQGSTERLPEIVECGRWPDGSIAARCDVLPRDRYGAAESVFFSHVTIACVTAGLTCLSFRVAILVDLAGGRRA